MFDPNEMILACIGFPVSRDIHSVVRPLVDKEGYALKPYDCSGTRIWWNIQEEIHGNKSAWESRPENTGENPQG